MTRIISIVAGKGGVGKTFLTSNLAIALTELGKDVIAIDSNLTTPNLGIHLGIPLYPVTLQDVIKTKADPIEALYTHPSGLRVMPAGIGVNDLRSIDPKGVQNTILNLLGNADIMLLDSAAGLGKEGLVALESADEALFIVTPDLPSVIDALKTAKIADQVGAKKLGVVVNRVKGHKYEMSNAEIASLLNMPILSTLSEEHGVAESIALRTPFIHHKPNHLVSHKIRKLAANLTGYEYSYKLPWYKRLLG
ncbi:MAG: cell division ATPase MinD [Candidatus Aenigmatarchaeota archaeon]